MVSIKHLHIVCPYYKIDVGYSTRPRIGGFRKTKCLMICCRHVKKCWSSPSLTLCSNFDSLPVTSSKYFNKSFYCIYLSFPWLLLEVDNQFYLIHVFPHFVSSLIFGFCFSYKQVLQTKVDLIRVWTLVWPLNGTDKSEPI